MPLFLAGVFDSEELHMLHTHSLQRPQHEEITSAFLWQAHQQLKPSDIHSGKTARCCIGIGRRDGVHV